MESAAGVHDEMQQMMMNLSTSFTRSLSDILPNLVSQITKEVTAALVKSTAATPSVPVSVALQTPRVPLILSRLNTPSSLPSMQTEARRSLFHPIQPVSAVNVVQPITRGSSAIPSTGTADVPFVNESPHAVSSPHLPRLKLNQPKPFTGTQAEYLGSRDWLQNARDWLELTCEGQPEHRLIRIFGLLLDGVARTWFRNLCSKAEQPNSLGELTLQLVFDDFLIQFSGSATRAHLEEQFSKLKYGDGDFADLAKLNAEFDRYVVLLYPGGEFHEHSNALLASRYADIIKKGSISLWEKTLDSSPTSLEEWKAAAQSARSIMDTKAINRQVHSFPTRSYYHSSSSSSSSLPRSSTTQSNSRASVHEMQHEDVRDDGTWQKQGGDPHSDSVEELQQMNTRNGQFRAQNGNMVRPAKESEFGSHLKPLVRAQLKKNGGKCFWCYRRGHRAPDCPDSAKYKDVKNRRQPTDAELNA